jgi:hypothetical protein
MLTVTPGFADRNANPLTQTGLLGSFGFRTLRQGRSARLIAECHGGSPTEERLPAVRWEPPTKTLTHWRRSLSGSFGSRAAPVETAPPA